MERDIVSWWVHIGQNSGHGRHGSFLCSPPSFSDGLEIKWDISLSLSPSLCQLERDCVKKTWKRKQENKGVKNHAALDVGGFELHLSLYTKKMENFCFNIHVISSSVSDFKVISLVPTQKEISRFPGIIFLFLFLFVSRESSIFCISTACLKIIYKMVFITLHKLCRHEQIRFHFREFHSNT